MSEYTKLKQKGMGRGRPPYTPAQKKASQVINSLRQEARRRALIVLKAKHADEFSKIYEQELRSLMSSTRRTKTKASRK